MAHIFGQYNTLSVPRAFVKMLVGDFAAALLLSQILYWTERKESKDGWFWKTYGQWEEELCLSRCQVDRAVKTLATYGVKREARTIRTANNKRNSSRVHYYTVDLAVLEQKIREYGESNCRKSTTASPQSNCRKSAVASYEQLRETGNCSGKAAVENPQFISSNASTTEITSTTERGGRPADESTAVPKADAPLSDIPSEAKEKGIDIQSSDPAPVARRSRRQFPALIADDWQPGPKALEWAKDLPSNLSLEQIGHATEKFRDYCQAKGIQAVDFLPLWRNWMRKEHADHKPAAATAVGHSAPDAYRPYKPESWENRMIEGAKKRQAKREAELATRTPGPDVTAFFNRLRNGKAETPEVTV